MLFIYNKKWYLEIKKIGLVAEISEGTDEKTLDNYIGHFVENDGTINTYNPNKYVLDDICESKVLFDLYKYTMVFLRMYWGIL